MNGLLSLEEWVYGGYMVENWCGELSFQVLLILLIGVVCVGLGECELYCEVVVVVLVVKKQVKKKVWNLVREDFGGSVFIEW